MLCAHRLCSTSVACGVGCHCRTASAACLQGESLIGDNLMADVNPHRALGCIVGAAVGDALGAPFEFGPAGGYTAKYPLPVLGGTGEMEESPLWELGEATDDTR
jgi:hypothetical protein